MKALIMSRFRLAITLTALGVGCIVLLVGRRAVVEYRYARAVAAHKEQQAGIVARLPFRLQATYAANGSVTALFLSCDDQRDINASELAPLRKLHGPSILDMCGCSLSDDAFRQLGALEFVGSMQFSIVAFQNRSLRHLTNAPRLFSLRFHDCTLTDAGLAQLAQIDGLAYLEILGSEITDAAIDPLSNMDALERLVLDSTPLSEEGVERLRKALPHTEIEWTPWDPADKRFGWQTRMEVMSRRMKEQGTATEPTD